MQTTTALHLTMSVAVHARFAHRVDGLIHSHPWSVEATVEGPAECLLGAHLQRAHQLTYQCRWTAPLPRTAGRLT